MTNWCDKTSVQRNLLSSLKIFGRNFCCWFKIFIGKLYSTIQCNAYRSHVYVKLSILWKRRQKLILNLGQSIKVAFCFDFENWIIWISEWIICQHNSFWTLLLCLLWTLENLPWTWLGWKSRNITTWVNYSLWFWPLLLTSWPPFIFDLHVFWPLLFLTFWPLFVLASFWFKVFIQCLTSHLSSHYVAFGFFDLWFLLSLLEFLILKQSESAGVVMLISFG